MKSFRLALQFLTTFRYGNQYSYEPADFADSLRWFPVIGLLLGGVQWLLATGMKLLQGPPDLIRFVLVVFGIISTGGLHLDGVADTADGFGAGKDRETILRIMKDGRLGVFAAAAIFLILYAKLLAFGHILAARQCNIIVLAPVISRTILALTCTTIPYARTAGTAKAFASGKWLQHGVPALLICSVILGLIAGIPGFFLLAVTVAGSALFNFYCMRKIGGFTGDTLGFLNELAEVVSLVASFLYPHQGTLVLPTTATN